MGLMDNPVEKSVQILLENRFMDVSTANRGPWVAPVFYGVDPDLNFYFVSRTDSRHGNDIENTNKAAVAIWDSTETPESADGLQIKTNAKLVDDINLKEAKKFLFKKRFENVEKSREYIEDAEKYCEGSEKRIFKLETVKMFKLSGAYSRTKIDTEKVKKNLRKIHNENRLSSEHRKRVI